MSLPEIKIIDFLESLKEDAKKIEHYAGEYRHSFSNVHVMFPVDLLQGEIKSGVVNFNIEDLETETAAVAHTDVECTIRVDFLTKTVRESWEMLADFQKFLRVTEEYISLMAGFRVGGPEVDHNGYKVADCSLILKYKYTNNYTGV